VAGLIYGLDFERIQSTLHSQGISNVRIGTPSCVYASCKAYHLYAAGKTRIGHVFLRFLPI
jgi:hypothetical protein